MSSKVDIYVINLDKSVDRMKKIDDQMSALNLQYIRFSAIYGKELSDSEIDKYTTTTCRHLLCNHSMIGCALSHVSVWKKIIESGADFALVLEDDANLGKDLPHFLSSGVQEIYSKTRFNMLSLFSVFSPNIGNYETIGDGTYTVRKGIFPLSTVTYVITRQGAEKLLELLGERVKYHIDFRIAIQTLFKKFENYYELVTPKLVTIDDSEPSTISTSKKSIVLSCLSKMKFHRTCWLLNQPVLTLNLQHTVSLYVMLLVLILVVSLVKKWAVLVFLCILELLYIFKGSFENIFHNMQN